MNPIKPTVTKVIGEIKIGEFHILKFDDGSFWIERADGEGMEVSEEEDLERMLMDFWTEVF